MRDAPLSVPHRRLAPESLSSTKAHFDLVRISLPVNDDSVIETAPSIDDPAAGATIPISLNTRQRSSHPSLAHSTDCASTAHHCLRRGEYNQRQPAGRLLTPICASRPGTTDCQGGHRAAGQRACPAERAPTLATSPVLPPRSQPAWMPDLKDGAVCRRAAQTDDHRRYVESTVSCLLGALPTEAPSPFDEAPGHLRCCRRRTDFQSGLASLSSRRRSCVLSAISAEAPGRGHEDDR